MHEEVLTLLLRTPTTLLTTVSCLESIEGKKKKKPPPLRWGHLNSTELFQYGRKTVVGRS